MSILTELKRRNVFRVAAIYIIVGWLLLQVSDTLVPALRLPDWFHSGVAFLLIIGFPIALIFAWAFELTPEGLKKEKDVDRSQSITKVTARKLDVAVIGLLGLILAYFAVDRLVLDSGEGADPSLSAPKAPLEQATVTTGPTSAGSAIAVLPFVNMSADAGNEYFADGMSEEILNALAKVEGLKVAGRTSSFSFKDRDNDLRIIGEALGVSHILEGSVRKAGDRVRITAQLIKADDGFHLWSETYDRELTDVFAIQDEIATAILSELKVRLDVVDGDVEFTALRAAVGAYDLYLEAKQQIYVRKKATLEEAADLLDRAIAIDSAYGPIFAQRGIVHILLSDTAYGTIREAEALEQAKRMFDRALSLDPDSAEAWAGLGLYYRHRKDLEKSIDALQHALAINPNLVDASNWLAGALYMAGDTAESYRVKQEVLVRDPLHLPGIYNLLDDHFLYGKIDEAQSLMDRVRPYVPASTIITFYEGVLLFVDGRVAESLPYFESVVEAEPNSHSFKGSFSRALFYTWQNERLVEEGQDEYKVYALMRLGRWEEASELAWDLAPDGNNVAALFRLLVEQRRCPELIEYLESRWGGPEAFEKEIPERDGWSEHNYLGQIAFCYRSLGNREKFQQALSRYKAALDYQRQIGANNHWFLFAEAVYAALAGDKETALDKLEQSLRGGFTVNPRLSKTWPMFEPLDDDPRLEAIVSRMRDRLNSERVKMGLAPI